MHATRSPDLLRIPEAAERLNVSRASVYRWIDEGRLPAVQLGGRGAPLRIPEAELVEWLDERRTFSDVSGSSGTPRSQTPAAHPDAPATARTLNHLALSTSCARPRRTGEVSGAPEPATPQVPVKQIPGSPGPKKIGR